MMLGMSLYALSPFETAEVLIVLPLLAAVIAIVTASMFRYTYGEIGDGGLRYRRLWGWRTATWSQIDGVDLDPKVKNAILIQVHRGSHGHSSLRFPEIWNQTDQERQEIIDLCRSRLGVASHATP